MSKLYTGLLCQFELMTIYWNFHVRLGISSAGKQLDKEGFEKLFVDVAQFNDWC